MTRFLQDNEALNAGVPSEFAEEFKDIFPDNTIRVSGSLGDTIGPLHTSPINMLMDGKSTHLL